MNTDYNKIKTRFTSNVIIEQLIDSDEAGYKVNKLFYEYERCVFTKIVMFEKYKKNKSATDCESKTFLGEMLIFYNKSLRKLYNLNSSITEKDLPFYVRRFLDTNFSTRIILLEKADKNMPPLFDYRKGVWHTENPPDISGVVTDIDQALEYYLTCENIEF